MLREIEVAAARVSDMVVSPGLVVLDLPLHEVRLSGGHAPSVPGPRGYAPSGAPFGAAGLLSSAGPLFPGRGGGTRSKEDSVSLLRGALAAANLVTTYQDANGIERQVFGGHACRVAGATFLAARGIPMAVIQLLGRWSSRAIERYTQSAPLALAPSAPSHGLASVAPGEPGGGAQLAVPLALADATPAEGQADEGRGTAGCPERNPGSPAKKRGALGRAPQSPVRPGGPAGTGGPRNGQGARALHLPRQDAAGSQARPGRGQRGRLARGGLRLAVRRASVLQAVCSAPRRGVLPSLLPGFVSPGIVDLRVRGLDVRVVTADSGETGFD